MLHGSNSSSADWRPLRILAIGSAGSTHVVNRVRCFAERGHHVALLSEQAAGNEGIVELVPSAPSGQNAWVSKAVGAAARVIGRNGSSASDMVRLLLDFQRLVRRANPDIVHVHYAYATWAWMAAVIGCKPLVVSVMGGDVLFQEQGSPTPRGISLTKRLLRSADLITAKSNFLIGTLDALGGYGRKAIRVVWGVDPEVFKPLDAGPLRRELCLPADARIVLSPKILQRFYNIDVLVEAMTKVIAVEPRAHLVLTEYGADPVYRAELKERIDALGLGGKVMFAGRVSHDRMPMFYSLADVAVGIPNSDGLPQTLLEAMGCGVPNVIGSLDRYGEIVRDGESAVFADVTPQGVADAVLRLLADEDLRRRIAARGREVVIAEANFPSDVARVEQAYFRLAQKRRPIQIPRPRMLGDVALYWLRPQNPLRG